ncbi:unnamed protein product [Boreogadus saida]
MAASAPTQPPLQYQQPQHQNQGYRGRRGSGRRHFPQACFLCKQLGHWIKDCPSYNPETALQSFPPQQYQPQNPQQGAPPPGAPMYHVQPYQRTSRRERN